MQNMEEFWTVIGVFIFVPILIIYWLGIWGIPVAIIWIIIMWRPI